MKVAELFSRMIVLEPFIHRESFCIAIRGKYDVRTSALIRSLAGLKYSSTYRCYYIRYSPEVLEVLCGQLHSIDPEFTDTSCTLADPTERLQFFRYWIEIPSSYREHLLKRRYSKSTCENYETQFKAFLCFIYPKVADGFSEEDITRYMLFLIKDRKVSRSTQNQAINAIKFYLEQVKGGSRREYYIERPRKESKLPTILSEEEIAELIRRTHYIKHKCMLMLLYSAGLRISELLNLKQDDIDSDRKLIYVRGGKGNKDRVTLLSVLANTSIKEYLELLKPKLWLFEGPDGGPYGATSVNKIIKRSAQAAGIRKRVSAHTLRHSFATHMLEQGTDLRYIQSLLGHESSKTTERYTQVTRKGFEKLVSPLDRIAGEFTDNKEI